MTGADNPAVTVLMPVRDGAAFLPATLASLAKLRGVDIEVLIVDDGSTDQTPALLAAAARRDPRMRVIRRRAGGIVAALNAGLDVARAPWIARLDADDLIHPDRVARQLAMADGLDVVATRIRCFPTQQISRGLCRYERWQNGLITHADMARARFVESPVVHPSVLVRRAVVRDAGGYRDLGWAEDYDLWLRLFARGARFGKVPAVLTFWRDHPQRLTRAAANCQADAIRACKAHHLVRGPLATAAGFWMAGTGVDGKRLARALIAEGARLCGWLDVNPRRLGQLIHGAPVLRAEEAPRRPDEVVLVAVGSAGGRVRARAFFDGLGWRECVDYWCVA